VFPTKQTKPNSFSDSGISCTKNVKKNYKSRGKKRKKNTYIYIHIRENPHTYTHTYPPLSFTLYLKNQRKNSERITHNKKERKKEKQPPHH
jgi:hypothetical protein